MEKTPINNIDTKHGTVGHRTIHIVLLAAIMAISNLIHAQSYSNDFENGYTWYPPWSNLCLVADSTETGVNHICVCDSIHEYGLGFSFEAGKNYPRQNVNCQYQFMFKAQPETQAQVVFCINEGNKKYWQAYPLADFVNDTAEWSLMHINLNFPFDYIGEGKIMSYIWNQGGEKLVFDEAKLEVRAMTMPSYQNVVDSLPFPTYVSNPKNLIPIVEYIDSNGDTLTNPSVIETVSEINVYVSDPNWWEIDENLRLQITTETHFKEDVRLLRLAYVWPLPEGELYVYRSNRQIDSTDLQPFYYLDREGFAIKTDTVDLDTYHINLCTYHNTGISSLQIDTEHRTACFNIDYWRDHPLIHYPLRSDTSDVFEDISYRNIKKGDVLKGAFTLYTYVPDDLPRLMPVWDGYQSAFIFTEHADWTDIRTHRAVLFGNENITKPEDAVGGFCYFNIPATKSVFYWNPDNVTNERTSNGLFKGLVASIKTDKQFYKLLKTIKKEGFEICLHSPEIYTTIPSEFPKAMRFMRRQFDTKSWIDHGYNNGPEKNREDLVCDGLLPDSPQYAVDLWKENGVRYLWNPYYEENRMEQYHFDSHFVQPYDGFGDALPNRQITTLPNGDKDFLLWSTPSTLEVNDDRDWYYYFDSTRLQRLVDNHNVFITHVYPAWSNPYRAFWEYNENGTAVAMPGFNFTLSQLARFRDEKKILPTTVEAYLSYYEKLQNVEYLIPNSQTIQLINHDEAIKGLTLLCTKPIVVEGKIIDFRKVDEGYLVWFDLGKNETVTIRYRE